MKYIDTDRLKSIIKAQIKERKEWMKDIDKSDRQDQLWSDLNGEDMSILQIIYSLQQEQQEVDLEKEIEEYRMVNEWSESIPLNLFKVIARYFYGLGQLNSK